MITQTKEKLSFRLLALLLALFMIIGLLPMKALADTDTTCTIDIDDEAGRQSFNMGSTPVFMIEAPVGTTDVNFISSDESNSLTQAPDAWTGNTDNGFIEQLTQGEGEDIPLTNLATLPRDLAEEDWGDIAVALKQLPAGDYYFFINYDAKETYPAYFIKLAEPVRTVLTVEDTEGNAYELTELRTPPTMTISNNTWPVDYVDGVYTVTVPDNVKNMRIALGDLSNIPEGEEPETYAYFAQWGGGLSGNSSEKTWHLTPSFLGPDEMEYGIPSYDGIEADGVKDYVYPTTFEDGFFTLPMSDFGINPDELSQRKEEVYGNLDDDCEYAEIFVGTHRAGGYCDFAALLLVKFEKSPVLTVEDTKGNAYELTEIRTPPTLTMNSNTWPADFVDGVYTVTVPKNTQDLRIALGNLANVAEGEDPETYAFFSKLGGLQGNNSEKIWHPDLRPINDEYVYGIPSYEGIEAEGILEFIHAPAFSDGFYTLPINEFALDTSELSALHTELYGTLDSGCEYAEVFIGTIRPGGYFDFDTLLLVKFEDPSYMSGPAWVQLSDGSNVEQTKLPGISSISMSDETFPFDQASGFYKLVVPEGTEIIKLKLNDTLDLPDGITEPLDNYFIGRRGDVSGSSQNGVPYSSNLYLASTVSGKFYATQTALDSRIAKIKPAKPKQIIINSTIVDAVDDNGWFTLSLSEFAFDTTTTDNLGVYGSLNQNYTYAEIQLQNYDGNSGNFGGMLLIQIGGDQHEENMTPVRKVGVSAATTEELDELEYSIDLSEIFEDLNGDAMTYKAKKSTEEEYTTLSGSVFNCFFDGLDVTYLFTANDGIGDGAIYKVTLTGTLLGMIRAVEAITADNSNYWTEYDFFIGPTQYMRSDYAFGNDLSMGYYSVMLNYLQDAKDVYANGGSAYLVSRTIEHLKTALTNLIIKTKVNVSRLWLAVTVTEKRLNTIDDYTEVTTGGLDTALAAAKTVYTDELYLSAYDAALQKQIDEKADFLLQELDKLVSKSAYKAAYNTYRDRKDEAQDILKLCNPADYHASDYTAASWQTFVDSYNTLKADLEYMIVGDGGTTEDYKMVKDFVKHITTLQNARNNLVSDRDITVCFSYINNFSALYPDLGGTDLFTNSSLGLTRGSTTVYNAVQAAGLVFDKKNIYRIADGRALQDGISPLLMVYINGINFGSISLYSLENGNSVIQLHDGDQVKVVRIPTPIVKSEASSGYDTTEISYYTSNDVSLYKDSIAVIALNNLPEETKVGDKAVFNASVTGGYATNLNQQLSAENLSLYVSDPSQTKNYSQNLVMTTATTNKNGTLNYIFTQPGWYTVAMLNAQQETYTFTNVYSETTYGSYGSIYAGDFALIYVAPAENESALIASQRTENIAKAQLFYQLFHDYDFSNTNYTTFKNKYNSLVSNQNKADSFKTLVDSFNSDYDALLSHAKQYAFDHAQLIQTLRGYLRYIPNDLSNLDYTFKNIINNTQSRYRSLNSYQKTLLSRNETVRLDALLTINSSNLYTPDAIKMTIEKDAGVVLPVTYGNLASAPNENRVYVLFPDGKKSETYYEWKTGNTENMEPSCAGMTAYPGNQIRIRRIITQSNDDYWLVYSLDGGTTWTLMTLVDGGANSPMVMLKAQFIMPEVEGTSLTFKYKTVSKTVYEEMKLSEETPEMALEEAKTAYKAALVQVFNSYNPARYTKDNFIDIRDAKNNGLDNISSAKEVTFAAKALNAAIEAMKAVPVKDEVHVIVRNDVFSKKEGAAWDGVLVDKWVTINNSSSMMGAIKEAVESAGYSGKGFESGYISDINDLGEFGGGRGSGWMGTLNDWFTNEGFTQFTVANGKLHAGDLICLEYTCALGSDIRGGVEGNTDTSLYELSLTGGTLTPLFNKGTVDYLFTLNSGVHATKASFSANNRSFQSRGYLNGYTPSADEWISTAETIAVESGDIIYIGVGETAWASMGSAEATVYTIAVVDDSGAVETLISALPKAEALTYADKSDVDRANAVYQSLNNEQKTALNGDLKKKLAACVARIALLQSVGEVKAIIDALPESADLTLVNRFAVEGAKKQFEALGSKGQDDLPIISINKINACVKKMDELVASLDIKGIFKTTGAFLSGLGTPGVGSIGGEWLVVGLSRAGYSVPSDWAEGYYVNAMTYINSNINSKGQLHAAKSTDNSRMILALTALGKDVTNVGGKSLLTALADLDYLKKQGINGPIWALIAFDSHSYTIPVLSGSGTQTTRDNLIATILADQLADGGWALSGINADPDMTAMALQALAPYYSKNDAVKIAVDKALAKLCEMQDESGGYGSWGTVNSESCAQVIVALSALDINPDTDNRFVKNGCSVIDALYTYYVDGGGFKHIMSGNRDGMASEQAYYALAAYDRLLTGKTSLYDMRDVQLLANDPVKDVETLINAIGTVSADSQNAIVAARAAYDSLTDEQTTMVSNYATLTAAEAKYKEITDRINAVKKQIEDIGEVKYDNDTNNKIDYARKGYDKLLANEKKYVTNYATLTDAETQYVRLKNAQKVIELINAIGEVTLDSEEAITSAREAYDALTAKEKALVSNYATLTAAERKLKALDPDGKTKVIGDGDTKVVIDGVTYMVDKTAATLMKTLDGLSKTESPSKQDIIDAYKAYAAMSDDLKAQVFNYDDLEAMTNELGVENHRNETVGMEIEGLEWYVQLEVTEVATGSAYDVVTGSIGSNSLVLLWDINLIDLLTGEEYEPGTVVKVKVKAPDLNGFEQIRIAHMLDDGRLEYCECTLEDGYIVWECTAFSCYALIGGSGEAINTLDEEIPETLTTIQEEQSDQSENSLTWMWILIACLAFVGIATLIVTMLIKWKKIND